MDFFLYHFPDESDRKQSASGGTYNKLSFTVALQSSLPASLPPALLSIELFPRLCASFLL
jgi:hypothetical protein